MSLVTPRNLRVGDAPSYRSGSRTQGYSKLHSIVPDGDGDGGGASTATDLLVQQLKDDMNELTNDESLDEAAMSQTKESIKVTTAKLESTTTKHQNDDDANRFEPLLGLYDVSHVITAKEGDNPVGGKWTRKNKLAQQIFNTRRSFQHLLPTNSTGLGLSRRGGGVVAAEAVNVISLDAFWRLIRLNVILRGDAVALTPDERKASKIDVSNLAVRAFFDAPRIILGKRGRFVNLQLGPSTSVVLDATYVDDKIRIGMGGTSGTRFIFSRCDDDDAEAMEFRKLLERKPASKKKILVIIGFVGSSAVRASFARGSNVVGGAVGLIATLSALAIAFSTGGLEVDGDDITMSVETTSTATTQQ